MAGFFNSIYLYFIEPSNLSLECFEPTYHLYIFCLISELACELGGGQVAGWGCLVACHCCLVAWAGGSYREIHLSSFGFSQALGPSVLLRMIGFQWLP